LTGDPLEKEEHSHGGISTSKEMRDWILQQDYAIECGLKTEGGCLIEIAVLGLFESNLKEEIA
jgi:hypothetical protein